MEGASLKEFSLEVAKIFESSPAEMGGRSRTDQLLWWESFYQEREDEHKVFQAFLEDHESPLCRVTGHVGSGKTTFVLEKLQRPDGKRVCNGFWVDLSSLSDELREVEAKAIQECMATMEGPQPDSWGAILPLMVLDAISEFVNRHIADTVLRRMHRHFLLLRAKFSNRPDLLRTDLHYHLEIDFTQPTEMEDLKYRSPAWRDVAASLAILGTDVKAARITSEALRLSQATEWPDEFDQQLAIVSDFLCERWGVVEQLTNIDTQINETSLVRYWLDAYSRLFYAETPVLILDNLDQMPNADLHAVIYDYVDRLALALRRTDQGVEPSLPINFRDSKALIRGKPFKLVYTVRDENIRSANKTTGRSYREYKLALANEGEGYIKDEPPQFLPLDITLLYEIVKRRMILVKKRTALHWPSLFKNFKRTVEAIWEPDKKGLGRIPYRGKLLLSALSNHSIQISLSLVHQLTLTLIYDLEKDGRSLENYLQSTYSVAFRGRVINWLFEHDDTGKPLSAFARRELELIKQPEERRHLCCAHRLLLTYLNNLADERKHGTIKISCGDLMVHMNRSVGMAPDHVKNTLFFLYQPQDNQREYITICEGPTIRNASDLTDNHDISINPRGSALLLQVMQRLEYWNRLAGSPEETGGTIFERNPIQAAEYLRPIVDLISEMTEAHMKNWKTIVKDYIDGIADNERPFDRYCKHLRLTVGQTFYIERAANSHLQELSHYIAAVFLGEDGVILLPESERKDYLERWPGLPFNISSNPQYQDINVKIGYYLDKSLAADDEAAAAVAKLGVYAVKYKEVMTSFNKLKNRTYEELCGAE